MYNRYGDNVSDMEKTEILNVKEIKKRSKKKLDYKYIITRIMPSLLVPGLMVLTIISTHSKKLILTPISYLVYILLALFIYLFSISFFVLKKKNKSKSKNIKTILYRIFIVSYIIGCTIFTLVLYGPIDNFRTWLISTSMSTMSHDYICKWFYSDEEIAKVLNSNYIVEIEEDTNTDLIEIPEEEITQEVVYENEYEEQILKREENVPYKLIELEVNGQKAYLAAIYDPSKVKVATSRGVGRYGQYATKMAEDNNAILATNGGGFGNAYGDTTGGVPTGVTIKNGKIISDNVYGTNVQGGGLIGLTYDNKLTLIRNATGKKALEAGVRDGVSWGPFLITNGQKAFIKGNGGWGYAARTAIGQRADGIILLLVVDSNSTRTKGASMVDLTNIMSNYGAINAANLDGGTSSVMILPQKEALNYISSCNKSHCYINDPVDSTLAHKTRGIATSIIVTE